MSESEGVPAPPQPRITKSHMRHYLKMLNLAIENHDRTLRRFKKEYYAKKLLPLKERTAIILKADQIEERSETLARHRNAVAQEIRIGGDFETWRQTLLDNQIDLWSSPESALETAAGSAPFSLSSSTLDRAS